MALVVKSWSVQPSARGGAPIVVIHGRQEGLVAFLLSLVGVDPTQRFELRDDGLLFSEGSLAGQTSVFTPLRSVATTFHGYAKPWREAVVLGALVAVLTFFLAGLPGLLFGVVYYWLNKTLTVGFTTVGGQTFAVSFKRSVIEGQNIDEGAAGAVEHLVRAAVAAARA